MCVGLSLLVCLILVVLDYIHNIRKAGEELDKVSENIVKSTNG